MNLVDTLKKGILYLKLHNASQEELLNAIESNPLSYDVVTSILCNRNAAIQQEREDYEHEMLIRF